MIKRLEYVHLRNYLHRDIKPQNFVMGIKQKKQQVFLIDFGLSKKYMRNKQHIPYVEGRSMIGTVRYASVNTHLGIQPTRRDDLQSLIYVISYFLYGRLPWQGQSAPTLSEKYNKILAIKIENKPQNLFKTLPEQMRDNFVEIFKHVRGLKFQQKPNYEMIKGRIRECMGSLGFENDYMFDWVEVKKKENLLQRSSKSPSQLKMVKSTSKHTSNNQSTILPLLNRSRFDKSEKRYDKKNKTQEKLNQLSLEQTLQRIKGIRQSIKK